MLSFKLPISLNQDIISQGNNNYELDFISAEQANIMQNTRNFAHLEESIEIPKQGYVDSFKFDHRSKQKKPRTKYTKENVIV